MNRAGLVTRKASKYLLGTIAACLVAVFVMVAFPNIRTMRKLESAESLLEARPDSALSILSGIAPSWYYIPSIRYRHTLLAVLADGGAARTPEADSALAAAHAFYLRHGDSRRKGLSWYCLGCSQLEKGAYGESALSFLNAEREAASRADILTQARSLRRIAESFSLSLMDSTAACYHNAAAEAFAKAGYHRHAAYETLSEVLCKSRYGEGDGREFPSLESYAGEIGDTVLIGCIDLVRGTYLMNCTDTGYAAAIDCFRRAEKTVRAIMDAEVYSDMALASQMTGIPTEADRYLAKAKSSLSVAPDATSVHFREAAILSERGYHEQAWALLDIAYRQQKQQYQRMLENSVAVAQRDYLFASRARARESLARRTTLWILSLFIIVLASAALYFQRKQRKAEQEAMLADLTLLREDLSRMSRTENQLHQSVGNLLNKELYIINELSEAYLAGKMTNPMQSAQEIEKHVQHLTSDRAYAAGLIQAVNLQLDNIIDRMKEQIPSLSPDELEFSALLFSGLSTGAIRILLSETRSNIYTKKSRIKAKIQASAASDKEEFLRHSSS